MGRSAADEAERRRGCGPRAAAGGASIGLGPALAGWAGRHPSLYLWGAWTVASILGYLLIPAVDVPWLYAGRLGIDLDEGTHNIVREVVVGVGVASLQYAVIRFVMGKSSGAVTAWIPVSVLVTLVEYFVVTSWLRIEFQSLDVESVIAYMVANAVSGLAQGILLAEITGTRLAPVLWILAIDAAVGVELLAFASGLVDRAASLIDNIALALVFLNATLGAVAGAVSGAALIGMVRIAARSKKAAALPVDA